MGLFTETALAEYAKRLIALKGQEDVIFKKALDNKAIRDLITFLNTDDQLGDDSIDSLGNKLFNKFTNRDSYAASDEKGRGGNPYTLNDTGAFWDSWKVAVLSGRIIIDADPFKEDTNLFDEYGVDVLGLTDENLQVLIDESLEFFIRWYERNILPQ